MDGSERAHARRVQVRYEARGYGLALAIVDDLDDLDDLVGGSRGPTGGNEAAIEGSGGLTIGPGLEIGDGVLTVGDTGVTTLELRRHDGLPSVLVWDAAEVDWDSLRAG